MKKKKLTNKEKAWNRDFKKRMQQEGVFPPDKPKLNRKKFASQVLKEYEDEMSLLDREDALFMHYAISSMVGYVDKYQGKIKVTEEMIGVLKVLKMALNYKRFFNQIKEDDGEPRTGRDLYEQVIKPVIDL